MTSVISKFPFLYGIIFIVLQVIPGCNKTRGLSIQLKLLLYNKEISILAIIIHDKMNKYIINSIIVNVLLFNIIFKTSSFIYVE